MDTLKPHEKFGSVNKKEEGIMNFRYSVALNGTVNFRLFIKKFSVFLQMLIPPREVFKSIYTNGPDKAMATHSSTLAWKIPWTEESGRPQSMGLLRVRHD